LPPLENSSAGFAHFRVAGRSISTLLNTRLRSLVNKSFTAATAARMRGRIQGLIDELLSPYVDGGRFDVIQDFARPLPVLVIADILGLPPQDRALLQEWSDGIAAGIGALDRAGRY